VAESINDVGYADRQVMARSSGSSVEDAQHAVIKPFATGKVRSQ
jgi:hypothetical protein